MPTVAAFLPRALLLSSPRLLLPAPPLGSPDVGGGGSRLRFLYHQQPPFPIPARFSLSKHRLIVRLHSYSASSSSFDELDSKGKSYHRSSSKESILLNLIQEIEPLDVTLIQKDVPPNTIDAMKRTISGMLGLLPSDQFNVTVEAFWQPLLKLLISSMKTGYTLRNAEYRLCLERSLDSNREDAENEKRENARLEILVHESKQNFDPPSTDRSYYNPETIENKAICDYESVEGLGDISPETQQYIHHLQSRLDSLEKELHDIKRENSALEMQQFVGEEKNDLLDYLRSLQPEKVAELSEPTCPGVEETIHSVVYGLLATLSPKMQSKPPSQSETTGGAIGVGNDDYTELVENTSIQFQPLISVSRDYLARLLFWCMLLGHYIRGLEYRLELMQLLTISGEPEILHDGDSIA